MSIHSTAIIAPSAVIGKDVVIGPYAIIEDDVVIGDRCKIDANASIKQYTKMGTDNHIHSFALVGGIPQDLKFHGEVSHLEMGNNNSVREFATIHRGTEGGGFLTKVGDNNLFMAYTHIAHDCIVGSNIVMSNGATLAGHVQVADYAIIGGLSAVHQFVRIGRNAFLGGMSGIAQDLPPFVIASGGRGHVHGLNLVGLRRIGMKKEAISALKDAYQMVWRSNLLRAQAVEQISEKYSNIPELVEFADFIKASTRGVCSAEKEEQDQDTN